MTGSKDPYKALGVEPSASVDEIRQAFKKLAKQHHPDVAGGENESFDDIRKALDVLTDPQTRKMYDEFGVLPGDEASVLKLKAMQELAAIFASILEQVTPDNITQVDVLATMRREVEKRQQAVGGKVKLLAAEEAKLTRYQQVMSARLKRKPGGKDIFFSVLEAMAAEVTAVRSHLDSEQRVVGAMIEELQNYTFEIETEQPRRASSRYGGWAVVNTWNT